MTIQKTHRLRKNLNLFNINVSLGITGCFQCTSRDKLYSELGLESLADKRFYKRLAAFYKTINNKAPQYLIVYLPTQDLASINLKKKTCNLPFRL